MNAYQHYALLMRTPRALALQRIIREVVRPGMHVLDAGCGSGLLSIWAAKAGATVVGVDMADLTLATDLAAENGVADKITFLRGDLNAIGLDRSTPFDVLLAMVYLNDPRRDEQASELVYGLKRYLHPDAVMVPDRVTYRAQALECPAQEHAARARRIDADLRSLESAYGMRMDTFRRMLAQRPTKEAFPIRRPDGSLELGATKPLSAEVTWHTVDYRSDSAPFPETCALPIDEEGDLTTVRWTQELGFGEVPIFDNKSIGWVHPARHVEPGTVATLRTGRTWREDNLLEWS